MTGETATAALKTKRPAISDGLKTQLKILSILWVTRWERWHNNLLGCALAAPGIVPGDNGARFPFALGLAFVQLPVCKP